MERVVNTKFYTFRQNNSGGYFVSDDTYGVSEIVIVEAINAKDAWNRLSDIGDNVSGFWEYCSCCGERWSNWLDDDDGKDIPMLYDTKIEEAKSSMFNKVAYVHYLDNTFKKFDLK